jgi:hypothetical protein
VKVDEIAKQRNCEVAKSREDLSRRIWGIYKGSIGWLGGARENWCPQRFKWMLEHRELVLEKPGSWCFLLVGAREKQRVGALSKLQLAKQRL